MKSMDKDPKAKKKGQGPVAPLYKKKRATLTKGDYKVMQDNLIKKEGRNFITREEMAKYGAAKAEMQSKAADRKKMDKISRMPSVGAKKAAPKKSGVAAAASKPMTKKTLTKNKPAAKKITYKKTNKKLMMKKTSTPMESRPKTGELFR